MAGGVNGMLHVLRVGSAWRNLHERYGKWGSVYLLLCRWAGQAFGALALRPWSNTG